MTTKELREKRNKLIADARDLVGVAVNSGAPLSGDDKVKIDALRAEAAGLADLLRNAEELDAESRAIVPESQRPGPARDETREARDKGVTDFLRRGIGARELDAEIREQSLTGSEGGYTVAPDTSFYGRVVSAMKFFGGVESAPVTVLNTAKGADLPIPTDDDTSNTGALVAEAGSHASGTAVTLGQTTLHSYLFSSKIVKVSWQLLQDSEISWEAFLANKFGTRIGRIKNTYLTTGTGSSQPQGVQYASTTGRSCATGYTVTCTADDLVRLLHSVDVAYRNPATCRWMLNDNSALILELLKDGDGQYLWKPGLTEGAPDRIKGYPVIVNNDMPDMAASAKSILFGDFSAYFVRNVQGIQVVRLNELYAANGQVGFMAFMRCDGALVDAGQHPIKAMANSAT
jgi:HK97 family phage major capsid protein